MRRTPIDIISEMSRRIVALPLIIYRKFISPLKPPCCKYYPSCSAYALDAVRKHGIFKGVILAVYRIARCNPWSAGGVDYVPDRFDLLYRCRRKTG